MKRVQQPHSQRQHVAAFQRALRLAGLTALALLVVACPLPFTTQPDADGSVAAEGSVNVQIGGSAAARSIIPQVEALVDEYRVTLSRSGFGNVVTTTTTNSVQIDTIATGTWNVLVEAINTAPNPDVVIGSGSATVSVTAGATAPVSVTVVPTQGGTGGIDITVTWPVGQIDGIESATLQLDGEGGPGNIATSLTTVTNGRRYQNSSIGSGSYVFTVVLQRGGSPVATAVEAVQVYDNVVTSGIVTLAANEIGQAPVAPSSVDASVDGDSVIVTWADESNTETDFTIERQTGGGAFSFLTSVAAGTGLYTDESVAPSTSYRYRVAATNQYGSSATVASATVTTPAAEFVYVDITGGLLTTGNPAPDGTVARPFRFVTDAMAVAQSGQTIRVGSASGDRGSREFSQSSTNPQRFTAIEWVDGVNLQGGWNQAFDTHDPATYRQYLYDSHFFELTRTVSFFNVTSATIEDISIENWGQRAVLSGTNRREAVRIQNSSPVFRNVRIRADRSDIGLQSRFDSIRTWDAVNIFGDSNPQFYDSHIETGPTASVSEPGNDSIGVALSGSGSVFLDNVSIVADEAYAIAGIDVSASYTGSLTIRNGSSIDLSAINDGGSAGGLNFGGGSALTVEDVTITGVQNLNLFGEGLITVNGDDNGVIVIRNNTLVGGATAGTTAQVNGISVGTGFGASFVSVTIEDNSVTMTGDGIESAQSGIRLGGTSGALRVNRNTVVIGPQTVTDFKTAYGIVHDMEVTGTGSAANAIANNVIARAGGTIAQDMAFEALFLNSDSGDTLVLGNTFANIELSATVAFAIKIQDGASPRIINNLFSEFGSGGNDAVVFENGVNADPQLFQHNAFVFAGSTRLYRDPDIDPTGPNDFITSGDTTLINDEATTTGGAAGTAGGNLDRPATTFANPTGTAPDFRLSIASSTAVKSGGRNVTGQFPGELLLDRDGNSRTGSRSVGFSIGAFEQDG